MINVQTYKLPEILTLEPNQKIYLQGQFSYPVFQRISRTWIYVPLLDVRGYETVSDIEIDFPSDKKNIIFSVKTGLEPYVETFNPEVILGKKSETKQKIEGNGATPPTFTGVKTAIQEHSNVNSDATMSNGDSAKLFSIAMPSVPIGTTVLSFHYWSEPRKAKVETVQQPALPSVAWIARVNIDGEWTNLNKAKLTGVFVFK